MLNLRLQLDHILAGSKSRVRCQGDETNKKSGKRSAKRMFCHACSIGGETERGRARLASTALERRLAVNHELRTPILLPAAFRLVRAELALLTVADHTDATGR